MRNLSDKPGQSRIWLNLIAFTAVLALAVFLACSDDQPVVPETPNPQGALLSSDGCKTSTGTGAAGEGISDECVSYRYNGGVLRLTHRNTAFNCCPDSVTGMVTVEDSLIIITESERLTEGGCRCLCLYDMDYEIKNLPRRDYIIRFIIPYTREMGVLYGDPLACAVHLTVADTGTCCIYRPIYPWMSGAPQATLTGWGTCKSMGATASDSAECLVWTYDGSATLALTHKNGTFNCCLDSVTAQVTFSADSIYIKETDHASNPCSCICPYDIGYQFTSLIPRVYHIVVARPYGLAPLVCALDLTRQSSGECYL